MKVLSSNTSNHSHDDFWTLWELQRGKLLGYCLKLLGGSEDEAKDVLGGALLNAVEAWSENRKELRNPTGWLFKIAHNQCMNHHRELEKRIRTGADPEELSARNRDLHPDQPESPEATFLRREMHINVEGALTQLPKRIREVMVLRCIKEYSYREIEEELQISNVTVRKRMQLGRESIREILDGYLLEGQGYPLTEMEEAGKGEIALANAALSDPYIDLMPVRAYSQINQFESDQGYEAEVLTYSHIPSRRLEQKISSGEQYIQKHPTGWKKRLELAELYYINGNWSASIDQTQQVLAKNPRSFPGYLLLARIHLHQSNTKAAQEILQQGSKTLTLTGIKPFLAGCQALIAGKPTEATSFFLQARSHAPGPALFKEMLGQAYLAMGEPAKTLEVLVSSDTRSASLKTLSLIYEAYSYIKSKAEAEQTLATLRKEFPQDLFSFEQSIQLRLASQMVLGHEGKQTLQLIRQFGKLAQSSTLPATFLSEFYRLKGKSQKAESELARSHQNHPTSLKATYHLARYYFLQGKLEKASRVIANAQHILDFPSLQIPPPLWLHERPLL